MDLKQKIADDMKAAMRSGDSKRRDAIRLLQAAIKQREVDERITLDNGAITSVMAALKPKLAGRADMGYVSGLIKEKIKALT